MGRLYDRLIFPDTFGWLAGFFGGMPFPNFYPPLLHWLTAFLRRILGVDFAVAFNGVVLVSLFSVPFALWSLVWRTTRNRPLAAASVIALTPMLLDHRFVTKFPLGLDAFSTLQVGIYSGPLGFAALLLWLSVYLRPMRTLRSAGVSALLLAVVLLSNVFAAFAAAFFSTVQSVLQLIQMCRRRGIGRRRAFCKARNNLLSVGLGLCLAQFWMTPALMSYSFFVTRPHALELGAILPWSIYVWDAMALLGGLLWLGSKTPAKAYPLTTLGLGLFAVSQSALGLTGLPLQFPRLLGVAQFLAAPLVAYPLLLPLSKPVRRRMARVLLMETSETGLRLAARVGLLAAVVSLCLVNLFLWVRPQSLLLSYFPPRLTPDIRRILEFARTSPPGRYLVEAPNPSFPTAAFDGRAIASLLGAEGHESLNVVFREASGNALFVNPLLSALSAGDENFGISSVLADDLDFLEQSTETHLQQALALGTRYLVMISPDKKEELLATGLVRTLLATDFWTIYEIVGSGPPLNVQVPGFRPALYIGSLSLKQRRQDQLGFTRFAEEQFAANWFEVPLIHRPGQAVDEIRHAERYGALVVEDFDCLDQETAFQDLRRFSEDRPLILLESEAPLFRRIKNSLERFPMAKVIPRPSAVDGGDWIGLGDSGHRYGDSQVRRIWRDIQNELATHKMPVEGIAVTGDYEDGEKIRVEFAAPSDRPVPVLIPVTYFPNWRRDNGQEVFTATPFFLVTYATDSFELSYGRSSLQRWSIVVSALALALVLFLLVWHQPSVAVGPNR